MADISLVESLIGVYYHAKEIPRSHLEKLKASKHLDANGKVTERGVKFLDRWFKGPRGEQPALLKEL